MKTEKKCNRCGQIKDEKTFFPKKGRETDKYGQQVYRGFCKACETKRKTDNNRKNRASQDLVLKQLPSNSPVSYTDKANFSEKVADICTDTDDYAPWSDLKGRELTESEKYELDSCMREFIITMTELVIKERGDIYE